MTALSSAQPQSSWERLSRDRGGGLSKSAGGVLKAAEPSRHRKQKREAKTITVRFATCLPMECTRNRTEQPVLEGFPAWPCRHDGFRCSLEKYPHTWVLH